MGQASSAQACFCGTNEDPEVEVEGHQKAVRDNGEEIAKQFSDDEDEDGEMLDEGSGGRRKHKKKKKKDCEVGASRSLRSSDDEGEETETESRASQRRREKREKKEKKEKRDQDQVRECDMAPNRSLRSSDDEETGTATGSMETDWSSRGPKKKKERKEKRDDMAPNRSLRSSDDEEEEGTASMEDWSSRGPKKKKDKKEKKDDMAPNRSLRSSDDEEDMETEASCAKEKKQKKEKKEKKDKPEKEERLAHVRDLVRGEGALSGGASSARNLAKDLGASPNAPSIQDPDAVRRRLSIDRSSPSPAQPKIANVMDTPGSLEQAGLADVFRLTDLGDRRAVGICSVTDRDGGRRSSFKEKNEEVFVPPGRAASDNELLDWLQDIGFGWACKKGLKPDSPNQDSFSILAVEDSFLLIGVYDGHGPKGHDVSQFAREQMVRGFMRHPKRATDVEAALYDTFIECQALIERQGRRLDARDSGSTCTMVYVDLQKCKLTVAHVGDARSALGKRKGEELESEDLTIDHKPNLEAERKRIESANPPGRVVFDGFVNYRVFVQDGMYPGLNMSRALGDISAHKEAGLTAMPDTRTVDLRPLLKRGGYDEVTLLVCTDGVWEFIETEEAFKIAAEVSPGGATAIVNRLALESWDRWLGDSGGEVSDDITCVCLHLNAAFAKKTKARKT